MLSPTHALHLQPTDVEAGARQLLDQLDDLSVDVPKAPQQVRLCLLEHAC